MAPMRGMPIPTAHDRTRLTPTGVWMTTETACAAHAASDRLGRIADRLSLAPPCPRPIMAIRVFRFLVKHVVAASRPGGPGGAVADRRRVVRANRVVRTWHARAVRVFPAQRRDFTRVDDERRLVRRSGGGRPRGDGGTGRRAGKRRESNSRSRPGYRKRAESADGEAPERTSAVRVAS